MQFYKAPELKEETVNFYPKFKKKIADVKRIKQEYFLQLPGQKNNGCAFIT